MAASRAGRSFERRKASAFAWVPISEPYREMGSIEFTLQALKKAEVALAPGFATAEPGFALTAPGRGFWEDGEGYLGIALVENENRLQQAVRQIRRAFPVGDGV